MDKPDCKFFTAGHCDKHLGSETFCNACEEFEPRELIRSQKCDGCGVEILFAIKHYNQYLCGVCYWKKGLGV